MVLICIYRLSLIILVQILLNRFQVKKKQFFRNFMTIMLFGAVGTLISFAIISLGIFNFPFLFFTLIRCYSNDLLCRHTCKICYAMNFMSEQLSIIIWIMNGHFHSYVALGQMLQAQFILLYINLHNFLKFL